MLIAQGTDPNGLPYVDQKMPDGRTERRYLAALPTPDGHTMKSAPNWETATGITPLARAEWPKHQFLRIHSDVPVLDQNGLGACVGFAATSSAMVLRARAGESFVLLSACELYSRINGGRDAGANGGDAAAEMTAKGIAPASLAPGLFYRPAGYSAAAMAAAARFKLADAVQVTSIEEAVTAVLYGWELIFDVEASGRYATDANGVVAYCGRSTNHEQHAGEGVLILPDGKVGVVGRNSWSASWGGGSGVGGFGPIPPGFAVYTEAHFAASQTTIALKYMSGDPDDPNPPPVLA